MTKQGMDELLRRWHHDEYDERRASGSLRASVLAIPDDVPHPATAPGLQRWTLIAALALLSTMLLAIALSFGGDLLRPPTAIVQTSATPQPATPPRTDVARTPETSTPPIALVLLPDASFEPPMVRDRGYFSVCWPHDASRADWLSFRLSGPGHDDRQLMAFEDARLVRSPEMQSGLEWEGWLQRRLSPTGIEHVIDEVRRAALPNCGYVSPASDVWLEGSAMVDGRSLWIVVGPPDQSVLRRASPDEMQRAAELVSRFSDLDAWLTADDWAESDWSAYSPDRWLVTVELDRSGPCRPPAVCGLPQVDDVVLPDGSGLLSFGELELVDVTEPNNHRCGIVDHEFADRVLNDLDLAEDADEDSYTASFAHPSYEVRLDLRGMLPHQSRCEQGNEQPGPAPSGPLSDAIPGLDACRLLGQAPLSPPSSTATPPPEQELQPQSFSFDGAWANCYRGPMGARAKTTPTSSDEAESYVRHLFGDGVLVGQLSGATVYVNSCFGPVDPPCRPAGAVSAPPYFVVYTFYPPIDIGEATQLIANLIESGAIR
jgi:hypothetical protein